MTIGQRIKYCREQKGLTQTELAERTGTTKQNIYKYENGIITNIPSDRIQLIADVLDVSPAYLMGWDDEFRKTHDFLKTITDPEHTSQQVKGKDAYIDSVIKNDELKFALFDGTEGVTDEMFDEVKQFAAMVKMREDAKKEKK